MKNNSSTIQHHLNSNSITLNHSMQASVMHARKDGDAGHNDDKYNSHSRPNHLVSASSSSSTDRSNEHSSALASKANNDLNTMSYSFNNSSISNNNNGNIYSDYPMDSTHDDDDDDPMLGTSVNINNNNHYLKSEELDWSMNHYPSKQPDMKSNPSQIPLDHMITNTNGVHDHFKNVLADHIGKFDSTYFRELYQRNNKRGGLKNLRCFPSCGETHKERGFCGRPVFVAFSSSITSDNARLVSWVEFVKCDDSPPIRIGEAITYRKALELQRSKSYPKKPWISGDLANKDPQTVLAKDSNNNTPLVIFEYNKDHRGWHYSWTSNKHSCDSRHALQSYLFEIVSRASDAGKNIEIVDDKMNAIMLKEDQEHLGSKPFVPTSIPGPDEILVLRGMARSPTFMLFCRRRRRFKVEPTAPISKPISSNGQLKGKSNQKPSDMDDDDDDDDDDEEDSEDDGADESGKAAMSNQKLSQNKRRQVPIKPLTAEPAQPLRRNSATNNTKSTATAASAASSNQVNHNDEKSRTSKVKRGNGASDQQKSKLNSNGHGESSSSGPAISKSKSRSASSAAATASTSKSKKMTDIAQPNHAVSTKNEVVLDMPRLDAMMKSIAAVLAHVKIKKDSKFQLTGHGKRGRDEDPYSSISNLQRPVTPLKAGDTSSLILDDDPLPPINVPNLDFNNGDDLSFFQRPKKPRSSSFSTGISDLDFEAFQSSFADYVDIFTGDFPSSSGANSSSAIAASLFDDNGILDLPLRAVTPMEEYAPNPLIDRVAIIEDLVEYLIEESRFTDAIQRISSNNPSKSYDAFLQIMSKNITGFMRKHGLTMNEFDHIFNVSAVANEWNDESEDEDEEDDMDIVTKSPDNNGAFSSSSAALISSVDNKKNDSDLRSIDLNGTQHTSNSSVSGESSTASSSTLGKKSDEKNSGGSESSDLKAKKIIKKLKKKGLITSPNVVDESKNVVDSSFKSLITPSASRTTSPATKPIRLAQKENRTIPTSVDTIPKLSGIWKRSDEIDPNHPYTDSIHDLRAQCGIPWILSKMMEFMESRIEIRQNGLALQFSLRKKLLSNGAVEIMLDGNEHPWAMQLPLFTDLSTSWKYCAWIDENSIVIQYMMGVNRTMKRKHWLSHDGKKLHILHTLEIRDSESQKYELCSEVCQIFNRES